MTPWALVLLLLLPATAALGYARLQRLPGRRGPIALAMRLAVVALLVGALVGPQWRLLERRVSVVFLVDASASVGAAGQRRGMEWAARAVPAAGPLDRAGLVLFGAAPRLAVPLAHYKTLPDPAGDPAGATNIGAALGLGLAMLPPGVAGRLVLLSDGQDTTNDESGLTSAEALALARGVPIDVVPIAPPRLRDVAVRALDVPRVARTGDHVPVRITLHSTKATKAILTLWIDGQAAQQAIALPAGDTVLRTDRLFTAAGPHTFRVYVDAPGDAVPQNNALEGATVVAPPGRVLLAVSDPAAATTLATTLARAHLTVIPMLAASLPVSAAAYRGYDDVVLDDVPATVLSRAQERALRDAVFNDGLGLVAVGGANSFGEGGYAHTPLEDALPVYSVSTPRRVTQPLALMLVIDKSGSMADDVDGVAKIDMVKVAANSALDKLADGDAVGVLAFDDTNHWIVPFHILQGAADKAHIRRQISGLSADGDTYIYPALHAAERAVLTVPTLYRHVVLLTDGQGEDAGFDRLIRRMHREHITLSTIGVGQDVVQDELRQWAKLGGGIFHYVSDPHDIPRIIVNEARYGTAGSSEVRGHIKLGVGTASPLLSALAGDDLDHLSIDVYDSTLPKATAQVAMQSGSGDPILSSWQYGLGRAVAWTSDAGTKWARRWSPNRLPEFWVDLVRWSMRGYNPGSRVPTLQVQDGGLQIATSRLGPGGTFDDTASPRVRLVRPDGTAQLVPLVLSGPGLYTASVPQSGPGIYTASFVRNDVGTPAPADVMALAVPYPAEYADEGVNTAFLTHLAATTGGRVVTRPADAFAHAGLPFTVTWLPLWPLLLALALLLFPIDVGLRLLLPPEPMYRQRR
jgi:secreted protein with Ig-like and vWFA domain